jgi:DNA topoisomerase-1
MSKIDKDAKILVIVESPNKCSHVSAIMKELGYKHAMVAATVGHLTEIKNVRGSYKNTGIYPDKDFQVTYAIADDKQKVVDNLKELLAKTDLVLIATDGDREGESIGYHVKQVLRIKDSEYYRITYQSITKDAIEYAIDHATKLDDNLIDAAEARQVVDKMIGFALSPIARDCVGAKSVGRCQSIGLKFIVDREKEIDSFVPERYYDLYLSFVKDGVEFKAKYCGTDEAPVNHLKTIDEVNAVKAECAKGDFVVGAIDKRDKAENPKPPFCTAAFQQDAANKLGLKVKDAMSCAQKLFEAGLISYHRTDTTELNDSFVEDAKRFICDKYGEALYYGKRAAKHAEGEQAGHEAIHCTDPKLTPELLARQEQNDLLVKVYALIWKTTLQSLMTPAIFECKSLRITNEGHNFETEFKRLKSAGYRTLD